MEESRPKELRGTVFRNEVCLNSEQMTGGFDKPKSRLTEARSADYIDLTKSESEDPTYVDGSETKQQLVCSGVSYNVP
jgi:hypothetical protein